MSGLFRNIVNRKAGGDVLYLNHSPHLLLHQVQAEHTALCVLREEHRVKNKDKKFL